MSALQTYLRNGGTIADLLSRYAIKAVRHRAHPNLVLFKYNQIESPFREPVVRSARGTILDEANNWRIVSRPFDKFFNHGEGLAASIDWSTARVLEKLDGSLCSLYHYAGQWHVQTSGTPDATGAVNALDLTFADLFWQVFRELNLPLPVELTGPLAPATEFTYMFELMTPYNRVVVRHLNRRLALIGIRHNETGCEFDVEELRDFYPIVRSFPLRTLADVEATLLSMPPLEQEGYVALSRNVARGDFDRVKIKSPAYVALHHMTDGFGPRRIAEIIRCGETSELLAHYPEWQVDFNTVQVKYDALVAQIESDYARIQDITDQKAFALEATKTVCSGALFQLRNGKTPSVKQFLMDLHIKSLLKMIGVRDTTPED